MSGASGTPYAASVLRALLDAGESVDLVVSRASRLTLLDETGISFRDAHWQDDLREWLGRGADGKPGVHDADIDGVKIFTFGPRSGLPGFGLPVGLAVGLGEPVEPPTTFSAKD